MRATKVPDIDPLEAALATPTRSRRNSWLIPASVSGMPRSFAFLSAVASSRRILPATASLVSGGVASRPSSSSDASR